MSSTRICGQCGAEVSDYSAEGLCPNCMLLGGLDDAGGATTREADGRPESDCPNARPSLGTLRYFGDYELLEEIARGGMGVVYRARQISLNRVVAVKMILAGRLANAATLRRFLSEAEAAANLHHPNIVAIYEVGEHDGQQYFSMEYVDGQNLSALVRDKPLSASQAARYMRAIAEAVQYAHECGTLHRDLKPSNVLLDRFDQPRITDFGLAKQLEAGDGERSSPIRGKEPGIPSSAAADLTLSGQVLGTPNFMPPEQAAGNRGAVSPASDVYSLGAILYHLVTARPPFVAESVTETLRLVAEAEPVSPRLLNPGVPRDLETITLKCLEKVVARRYGTARELADELGRFLRDEPIQARPASAPEKLWRWCRRQRSLAGSLVGLVLAIGIGFLSVLWQLRRVEAQRQRTGQANLKLETQRAESLMAGGDVRGGLEQMARLVREHPYNPLLAERLFSALNQHNFPLPLTPPLEHLAQINDARFSPDGKRVVTASDDQTARVWDSITGEPLLRPLHHPSAVNRASFSPDGRWILTTSAARVVQIWEAQTGEPAGPPLRQGGITSVQFSPDGKRVVTSSTDKTARVWEAGSGQLLTTIEHASTVAHAEFSSDGQSVVTSGEGSARVWSAHTGKPLTKAFGNPGYNKAHFSPDGQRIATVDNQGSVRLWAARTGEPLSALLDMLGGYVKAAAFNPDGESLLVVYLGGVQLLDAHTGKPLLSGTAWKQHGEINAAAFSADGQFVLTAAQDKTVVIRDAHSGRAVFEPIRQGASLTAAHFSPDGQRVVTASRDKTARVWDVRHGQPLPITFRHDQAAVSDISAAHFSPDGRSVLTASLDHSANVWNAETGQPRLSPPIRSERIYGAQFSPDGQLIATITTTLKVYEARTMQPVVGAFGPVANPRKQWIWSVAFSPDSQRVVTCGPDDYAHIWEARTGKPLAQPMGHNARVYSAKFSPNGQKLVTASEDATARIWNASTGEPLTQPLRHDDQVNTASFANDGQRVVTASVDETARIWDAVTGKELGRVRHHNEVVSAGFSPDGTIVVTASLDMTARVWDSRTGQPLGGPLKHDNVVKSARFSPDGQRVITTSSDHTARVWDARTGQPLTDPFRFEGTVGHGVFSPEGERVLAGSKDGNAAIWTVPRVPVPVPAWLPVLAEVLARGIAEEDAIKEGTSRDEVGKLRDRLAKDAGPDFYSRWATWFFADRSTRTISPFSTVTMPAYIQRGLDAGTLAALREAARLSPTNAQVLAALAWAMSYEERSIPASIAQGEFLSRRALQIAPRDADVWEARAAVLEGINLDGALEAVARATELAPTNPNPWALQGTLLAETNRLPEAYQSFSKAIELAETTPKFSKRTRKRFLADRRDLLMRMGRMAEAGVDNCRSRGIPVREVQTNPAALDLSAFYNWRLANDGLMLPPGLQHFAGVDFDARAVVQVAAASGDTRSFPKTIIGIPIGRRAARLHFLHATSGDFRSKEVQTGNYVIHYADGQQAEIPLVFGKEIGPFDSPSNGSQPTHAELAWTRFRTKDGKEIPVLQLYKFTWINPRPEVEVRGFDVNSAVVEQAPSLLAVTVE